MFRSLKIRHYMLVASTYLMIMISILFVILDRASGVSISNDYKFNLVVTWMILLISV